MGFQKSAQPSASQDWQAVLAPPPPKKRSKLGILFRFAVRLAVAAVLIFSFLLALISFTPLSFHWADEWLRRQCRDATGMRLQFRRAEWTLSRGTLRIDLPRLADPKTREPLVELASVECKVDIVSLLRSVWGGRKQVQIERIIGLGPLDLAFEEREGKIEPDPRLARFIELLRRHDTERAASAEADAESPGSSQAVDFHLGIIDLSNMNFAIKRISAQGDKTLLQVADANLLAEFNGDGLRPSSLLCVGKLRGERESASFKLNLQPSDHVEEIALNMTVQPFDSREHLPTPLPRNFTTASMSIQGMLRKKADKDWVFHSDIEVPRITLVGAGADGADQVFEHPKLFTSIEWADSARSLNLLSFELASADCDLKAEGKLDLFDPYHYELKTAPLTLRGEAIALIERNLSEEQFISKPCNGTLELRGNIAGRFGELVPDSVGMEYAVRDIALVIREFPEPVTNLRLGGSVTEKEFNLKEGFAVIQGIPLQVSGKLMGKPVEGKIDRAELAWKTAGQIEGISDLLKEKASGPISEFSFAGGIVGSGAVKLENPELGEWAKMLDKADIEGSLRFNGAELRHRGLKKPVRNLNGLFEFKNGSAALKNISGEIEDVAFSLEGTLRGKRHFWDDPLTTLSLQSRLNLAHLRDYYDWVDAHPPEDLPEVEGRATLAAQGTGPLSDWRAMNLRGTLAVEDLSVPLNLDEAAGTVRSPRLELAFAPDRIKFVKADANWQGVALSLQGEVGLDEGDLTLNLDGPMTAYRECLPGVLKKFIVDGSATVTHQLHLRRLDREKHPMRTFSDLIASVSSNDDSSSPAMRLKDMWKAEGGGTIQLTNVEMTRDRMPTRIYNAFGKLRYDNDHLWSEEPVQVKPGDNAVDTQAMINVVFGKRPDPVVFTGVVTGTHVNLDDWIQEWKKPAQPAPNEPEPAERKKLFMDISVQTKEVTFRKMKGKNLTGRIYINDYTNRRTELIWENARAEFKSGWANVSGHWDHSPARQSTRYDIQADHIDVADLIAAFLTLKKNSGLSSGVITGKMSLTRDGAPDPPYFGGGAFTVEGSRFASNAIFGGLGSALGLEEIFNDISFPKIEGSFDVEDSVILIKGDKQVIFENPSLIHPLTIKAQGKIGPEKALDLNLSLQFLSRVSGIPVVGKVWDVVNQLAGSILRYHVRGTFDEPEVSVLPKVSSN